MKRFLAFVLLLLMVFSMARAEHVPTLAPALEGVLCYPEDADEASAIYVYRYSYPQLAGDGELAELINGVFGDQVAYARDFRVPMTGEELDPLSEVQSRTTITHEVTCLSERYLSVKVTMESLLGAAASTMVSGYTFCLGNGAMAGTVTSLPYLLGLLDAEDLTDEWLVNRQTAKADECVCRLIWDIIEQQRAEGVVAYNDDLTYEVFAASFFPEEDFYLDADGNPVFFIQESFIAPASEGALFYPFSLEELLDEI